jgi:polyphenol oxidase
MTKIILAEYRVKCLHLGDRMQKPRAGECEMTMVLIKPDWPAPAHVHAAFTGRTGGASSAPFDSMNLGDHVNDRAADVAANRALLQLTVGTRPVFLKQVHGWNTALLNPQTPDGTVADACATQARGVACTIMVADCLPVLFTDRAGSFAAAAHAGWRGLLGDGAGDTASGGTSHGVLEQVSHVFGQFSDVDIEKLAINNIVNDVLVWLGPCIGPQHFEVGSEVREAFIAGQAGATQHFEPVAAQAGQPQKYLANLSALARDRLRALGFVHIYGNDGSPPWCTVGNASEFFSHRRDAARLGSTGRMAACIWLGS